LKDFIYLLVVSVLCLIVHAVADRCEQSRVALDIATQRIENLEKLLMNDSKVDHFFRHLKSRGVDIKTMQQ